MTEKELLEEYPFLEDKDFRLPKKSIFDLLGKDKLEEDRAYLLDRINEWSENDDDMFFYEMLSCVKFILEDATAYTTPDRVISLNYPCTDIIPQDANRYRRWYFVFAHECLHQLWDTFGVEKEIIDEKGSCDHEILNIAADCVINDYLSTIDKSNKMAPTAGVFPDVLEEKYGVKYDRAKDTQYSLYCKLNEISEELKKEMQEMFKDILDQMDKSNGETSQSGQSSNSGQSNSSGDKEGDKKDGNGSGSGDKKDGKEGDKKDGNGSGSGDKKDGKEGDKKDGNGSGSGDRKDGKEGDEKDGKEGSGSGAGTSEGDINERELIQEVKRHAEQVCKKYADTIVGSLSTFTSKCSSSKHLERPDITLKSKNGNTSWVKEVKQECDAYVKNKLYHQKRYHNTYNRVRRGERTFTADDMRNRRLIIQGREEIKDKIGFDIALYIDTSGSMSKCISSVFSAAYGICDKLKKEFGQDAQVDKNKINLKSFVFTTTMREIKYGQKCSATGGTYSFDELLHDIHSREAEAFLNIVITDGEFGSIDVTKITNALKDMEGMFILVVNNTSNKTQFDAAQKEAEKKYGRKFRVIYADSEFSIK